MEPADPKAAGAAEAAPRLSTHPSRASAQPVSTKPRTEQRMAAGDTVRDMVLLFAAVAVAHFPLLLNDGLYWDDWLLFRQLQAGDWASIDALVREAGVTPFNAAFFDLFAYLPGGVLSFRLVVFLLIVAMAWLAYAIAAEAGLGRRAALLIALIASVFPGFQDWPLLSTAASELDYAIFLGATLLLLRVEREPMPRSAVSGAAAAVLFVLSFGFNSMLTLYFACLLVLVLVMSRSSSLATVVRRRWTYLGGLVVLPLLYWAVSQKVLRPSGLYAGFNEIHVTPSAVGRAYYLFVVNGILDQFAQAVALLRVPALWPLLVVIAAAAVLISYRGRWAPSLPLRAAVTGAVVGAVGLGLAIFPYAAVGKFPSVHSWDTRHDLLVAFPLAVMVVTVVLGVANAIRASWLGAATVLLLCAGLALAGLQDYASLQARWASDRAVIAALKAQPDASRYSVYWVHDGAPGPEDFYRFYEWSSMLGDAYGGESRLGLDSRGYDASFLIQSAYFTARYHLAGFDHRGCQADLVITRGAGAADDIRVSAQYTWDRLIDPDAMSRFLAGLVTVSVGPRPSAGATDCPS